jgi:hypothetical protein
MSCPICGAHCKCKNRGAGGICCSCHRHKVRRILVSRDALSSDPATRASYDQHITWLMQSRENQALEPKLEFEGGEK